MNVFIVGSICFTSPKQEDLLIDYSTRVVISIKETLLSELHECSRRAWKREPPPWAKSTQKSLMKNTRLCFQMRSLKKMIPATNAPWQQPAHAAPPPNIHSDQNLLLWERNLTPKTIWLDCIEKLHYVVPFLVALVSLICILFYMETWIYFII